MQICKILKPGALSMVQDLGRQGYYSIGIPSSGAFDRDALMFGNKLLENPPDSAGLEIVLGGLKLEFLAETCIAVTGADLGPTINNRPVPMWQTLSVLPGQILKFTGRKTGLRSYLLFAVGLDVPLFLDSRSTYLFLGEGGFQGRKLGEGDILTAFSVSGDIPFKWVPDGLRPNYGSSWRFRIVYGLQHDFFTEESLKRFESATWTVTSQMDRMGLRLRGPTLDFKSSSGSQPHRFLGGSNPSNITAEGNPLGTIETTGSELILIGPDGPCDGGYAKLGVVISADFSLLGQVRPGNIITFVPVLLEEAYEALNRQHTAFMENSMETKEGDHVAC